ncbi:glycosyl hydrolase-related protein [Acaricomes phytoseiuli]|uniref:glycosyl hydrolase-related protein n=1 Tax=Acaricomes phytoseiuli TaxID=291968 RepID=UPI0012EA5DE3|nr:glycosyl hydrolase-related protein [Acaricomes phytoseiuli]
MKIRDMVREGLALNIPKRELNCAAAVTSLIEVDEDAVVISAIKLAEDRSGDVTLRLYESTGGWAKARVSVHFDHTTVAATDLLKRPLGEAHSDGAELKETSRGIQVELRPFQILTLRLACLSA